MGEETRQPLQPFKVYRSFLKHKDAGVSVALQFEAFDQILGRHIVLQVLTVTAVPWLVTGHRSWMCIEQRRRQRSARTWQADNGNDIGKVWHFSGNDGGSGRRRAEDSTPLSHCHRHSS